MTHRLQAAPNDWGWVDYRGYEGLRTLMQGHENRKIREYAQAIIDYGEKEAGDGVTSLVFYVSEDEVVYLTDDPRKHDYLYRTLGIAEAKSVPIEIQPWSEYLERIFIYVFKAERLYPVTQPETIKQIKRLQTLIRILRDGREIWILDQKFNAFCQRVRTKRPYSFWVTHIDKLEKWAKRVPSEKLTNLVLDMGTENFMVDKTGEFMMITDPYLPLTSKFLYGGYAKVDITKEDLLLDLAADFLTESITDASFEGQLREIQQATPANVVSRLKIFSQASL